jgi:hypothetical protein
MPWAASPTQKAKIRLKQGRAMSEQQMLLELSVDNIRSHVRHIVDAFPSRLAGSPNAARMAEYSTAQL